MRITQEKAIERVTTRTAAEELNMDLDTLQYLMRKERLPIGYAVKKDGKKRTNYVIYRGLLDGYKQSIQRGGERRLILTIWSWIQLLFVILFAMAAGAACYHQYQMLNKPAAVHIRIENHVELSNKTDFEPPEIEVRELTKEEIEEEEYFDSLELMALCVEAEAGNQGLEGKRMVADVILNRVDSPDWPDTIEGVISQKYQFTTYWDGAIERAEPTEETFEAIRMELKERSYPNILYFTAGEFGKYGTQWKQVGDHYFSTK